MELLQVHGAFIANFSELRVWKWALTKKITIWEKGCDPPPSYCCVLTYYGTFHDTKVFHSIDIQHGHIGFFGPVGRGRD